MKMPKKKKKSANNRGEGGGPVGVGGRGLVGSRVGGSG